MLHLHCSPLSNSVDFCTARQKVAVLVEHRVRRCGPGVAGDKHDREHIAPSQT